MPFRLCEWGFVHCAIHRSSVPPQTTTRDQVRIARGVLSRLQLQFSPVSRLFHLFVVGLVRVCGRIVVGLWFFLLGLVLVFGRFVVGVWRRTRRGEFVIGFWSVRCWFVAGCYKYSIPTQGRALSPRPSLWNMNPWFSYPPRLGT